MEKQKPIIFILVDYRDMFYSSSREEGGTMNVPYLQSCFQKRGYKVIVEHFWEVDFDVNKYRGAIILYQSSEDPGLKYKSYIEDVLIGLRLIGAILMPDFHFFRAHHNKVCMEILRDTIGPQEIRNLNTKYFGTYEDLAKDENVVLPSVVKISAGSRSKGVTLATSQSDLQQMARKASWTWSWFNITRRIKNALTGRGFKPISQHRGKFIVQEFVPGLVGDYRVLVYGDKYYVLRRDNRPSDFRASGSGLKQYPTKMPVEVLKYSRKIFEAFGVPYTSLDIAVKGDGLFLLEFQFVVLGQYTLEYSDHYYTQQNGIWQRIDEPSDLEDTMAYAVDKQIRKEVS